MNDQDPPEAIFRWLDYLEQQGKAESTIRSYTTDLCDFAQWYRDALGEELRIAAVQSRDIENYKTFLRRVRQVAPRTVNRRLAALSRFFKWAAARNLVEGDPTAEVHTLRLPPRQPKALTPVEEHRLRRAVYSTGKLRDIAIVEMLLETGMRVGELLAMRRGDVAIHTGSGTPFVRRGKGEAGRRIPLRTRVRRALQIYLAHLGDDLKDDDPLWWGTRGPLKSPSGINRIVAKYALQAGIEGVTPHTLRHTFARRYLEANPEDLRGLASLLGHSSLDTVMIYTEPQEDDLLEKLEKMGELRAAV